MDTRKIFRLAVYSSLVLGSRSIQNARAEQARAESPCDKDGPFVPRVDQDLLRKDLVIKPAELPRVNRGPPPTQAQERGVCQDAQTSKPLILPDPPSRSGRDPGGDEGDPSLPRGDNRDLRRSNQRGDATPPFFLRTTVFPLRTVCCKPPQPRFLSGRWLDCLSNFHLPQAVKLKPAQAV
jgi:hypothetical protein